MMKRTAVFLICALYLGLQASFSLDWRREQQLRIYMPREMTAYTSTPNAVTTTAMRLLESDMQQVLDADLQGTTSSKKADIVCAIDPKLPREGFRWDVKGKQLHIYAADAHGMAYGMLEISRKLGISPWEDWLDATPAPLSSLHLDTSDNTSQAPQVSFRGIFINDEDWGLNPWATRQEPEAWVIHRDRIKGAVGPHVSERIFRLMLRLRLNYYWPPMHECTQPFFLTPGNREMAARYGIYVGGSHCEPMASSAAAEWGIRGEGEYNYVTNREKVLQFWQERLDSVKGQEILYTLGMRGVHDGAMQGVKTRDEKRRYLQQVIDDQRTMLASTLGREITQIPQVFVPYKEVLDIYLDGLRVPDDVTLMWTDDNYGYVRHYPDSLERCRKGGNGLYYHVSYWGRPHDYCWLSTLSPYLMEQQLTEAYHRGIQQIWMLNVGDIKPAELQIHLFAALAWQGVSANLTEKGLTRDIMREMIGSLFPHQGKKQIESIISCLDESFRLAWDRKPEHLAGTRVEEQDKAYWNEIRPIEYWSQEEVQQRLSAYQRISDAVEQLSHLIEGERQDAFLQLIQYPIQAAALMNQKFLCPELTLQAQDAIHRLTQRYNKGIANGGKWDGIMTDAPRGLRVFQPVKPQELPIYSNQTSWKSLLTSPSVYPHVLTGLGTKGWMLPTEKGKSINIPVGQLPAGDSITIRVHLLPTMPIDSKGLAFSISVDEGTTQTVHFETYDRSEDWKRNVLRNCSERIITLPTGKGANKHHVTFKALTDNVVLDQIDVAI